MNDRRRVIGVTATVLGVATVLAALIVYEFGLRQPANHPQVEVADAAVARLDAGADPATVVPGREVEIGSPDVYVMVLDSNRMVLATSAHLGGATVVPPAGVFDYALAHGDDRITWQPAPEVRSAIVVEAFRGGFVVAGRTLSDSENLEGPLVRIAILAWIGIVAVGTVVLVVALRKPEES
ncbi:MAG TPA: hypothetical protein VGV88_13450 [Candidatus Dormibacteraeota bacterium]|nr:hypothetical protein [Candidatus Dormibacteraeota bacterium]